MKNLVFALWFVCLVCGRVGTSGSDRTASGELSATLWTTGPADNGAAAPPDARYTSKGSLPRRTLPPATSGAFVDAQEQSVHRHVAAEKIRCGGAEEVAHVDEPGQIKGEDDAVDRIYAFYSAHEYLGYCSFIWAKPTRVDGVVNDREAQNHSFSCTLCLESTN